MTNPAQVYPDPDVRDGLSERNASADLFYPDRRLGGFAALLGFQMISLVAPLRAYAERNNLPLHGPAEFAGGHWNKTGHAVAGHEIAQRLCDAYGTAGVDGAMSLSLLKFVGQASLVDDAMLPS